MHLWLWPFVAALGVGLFLSAGVAAGRGDGSVRLWLVTLLLALTDFIGEFVAMLAGFYRPPVVFLTYPVFYALGPAFWLLTRAMTGEPVPLRRALPHLVPVLLIAADQAPLYADLLRGTEDRPRTLLGMGGYTMMIVQLLHMGLYVAAGLRHLRRLERSAPRTHSGDYVVRTRWIRRTAAALAGVIATMITAAGLMAVTGRHVAASEYAMALSLAAVTLTLGWMVMREPQILERPLAAGRYDRSPLAAERLESYAEQLLATVERHHPWRTPDLRLADLAEATGLSRHHLSQVLSRILGLTFYEFVNRYRVREAARQLLDPGTLDKTILAIAYESGFSSKASFNRVFKEALGVTPSQFRRGGSLDHPRVRRLTTPGSAIRGRLDSPPRTVA